MVSDGRTDDGVPWDQRRTEVLERDDFTCQACGKESPTSDGRGLCVHHIHLDGCGGSDQLENLITFCERCHDLAHHLGDGETRPPELVMDADHVPDPDDPRPEGLWPIDLHIIDAMIDERPGAVGRANPTFVHQMVPFDDDAVEHAFRRLVGNTLYINKVTHGLFGLSPAAVELLDGLKDWPPTDADTRSPRPWYTGEQADLTQFADTP